MSNKEARAEAAARCQKDFYCLDLYKKEEARREDTSNHLDVFFVLCFLMFGLGFTTGNSTLGKLFRI